jgi:drug/metabolite transporter (DMT)-like permease
VVFTALLGRALGGARMGPWMLLGAGLATCGAATIGGRPSLSFDLPEWLTVGCGFVFALHILATDKLTRRHAALPLSFATYAWVTLGSLALLGLGLAHAPSVNGDALLRSLSDPNLIEPVLLSAVLGTVIALTLMNHFQRQLSPVRAAILYALEPVWAALLAVTLRGARVDGWLLGGGLALLAGNLLAELGPRLFARARAAHLSGTKGP